MGYVHENLEFLLDEENNCDMCEMNNDILSVEDSKACNKIQHQYFE